MSEFNLQQTGGYLGAQSLYDDSSIFNALVFLFEQLKSGQSFAGMVQVVSVTGGGPNAAPPRASVTPMVDQIDDLGNRYPHGTVYNIPCFRLQSGVGAVVLDPVVGDKGLAVVCHRDHSIVKATAATSGPGSRRQNSWSDGCYFGSFLNGAPTNYVEITQDGMNIVTPGTITISASNAMLDAAGNLTVHGEVTWNAATTATHASTHEHPQGADSHGDSEADTGPPVPGS